MLEYLFVGLWVKEFLFYLKCIFVSCLVVRSSEL